MRIWDRASVLIREGVKVEAVALSGRRRSSTEAARQTSTGVR